MCAPGFGAAHIRFEAWQYGTACSLISSMWLAARPVAHSRTLLPNPNEPTLPQNAPPASPGVHEYAAVPPCETTLAGTPPGLRVVVHRTIVHGSGRTRRAHLQNKIFLTLCAARPDFGCSSARGG